MVVLLKETSQRNALAIEVELVTFLRTGDFGGIRLGMSRQEILDLIGTPPDWMVTRRRKRFEVSGIWKYGSIEFHLEDYGGPLWMIFTDHFPLEGSETLNIVDPWLLRGGLDLAHAITLLTSANLRYQLTTDAQTGETRLTFESGVVVSFTPVELHPRQKNRSLQLTGFWLSTSSRNDTTQLPASE